MKHSLRVFLVAMLISAGVLAQEFSGIGDPSSAPGNPRSSYALSNLDHVNYYDGHVNVAIPVLTLGGRGSVSHTITIPIERTWEVSQLSSGLYSPGSVQGDEILTGSYTSGTVTLLSYTDPASGKELTYITWQKADQTQTILKDVRYNGLPQLGSVNRGRIFASTDGSDLVFYNDVDVIDGAETPIANGTLITRDGTRYQFSAYGNVRQIEDRNGNRITFSFQSTVNGGIYGVTDAAGRTETINYTESPDTDSQDVLTYSGYGGAPRTVKINYSYLGGALAAGESLQSFQNLFPELSGSSTTQFNPVVVSSIELADQTSYTMKYNCYGELASLSLPTGGIYRYYYKEAGGATNGANGWSGVLALDNNSGYRISRPLLERDELADGVNVSARMIFSDQGSVSGGDPQHSTRATTHSIAQFTDGPSGQLLRVEYHDFWGNSQSTAAPPTDPLSSSPWWEGIEFRTQIADGSGILQTKEMVYWQRPLSPNEGGGFDPQAETAQAHDPQVCQVNTTFDSKTSAVLYQYDSYNNVSFQYEYDYGAAPPIGPGCISPPTATRTTWNTYVTDPSYTDPSVNLVSLPATTQVEPSKGDWHAYRYTYDERDSNHTMTDYPDIVGHDPSYGAARVVRGNVTTLGKYANDLLTNGTEIYTGFSYDVAGNVTSVIDQNAHKTQFSYGDDHSSYAHATMQINAKGQQTTAIYDWSTGKVSNTTDSNGVLTTYAYVNALERLTEMDQAVGATGAETHTKWEYPNATTVIQKSDQGVSAGPGSPLSPGDGTLQSESIYDGLGRLSQSIQLGDILGAITTTTTYDALGRVRTVSNPVRAGSPTDPAGTMMQEYDALNRPSRTTYQDGSVAVTMYSGNTATVKDPAGITRQLTYDGLGRLTSVMENPNQLNGTPSYTTNYAYDPIDDLIQVTQGAQVRTFVYSTLGWLDKSIQPESGTTIYGYDGVGNLASKTDGRGVQAIYSYDELDRIQDKQYPNSSTPAVHYGYDEPADTNGMGRLTSVSASGVSTNFYSYDALGRVAISTQTPAGGQPYPFTYAYNLAGALLSETYPSGRVVKTGYDAVNRVSTVTGTVGGQEKSYMGVFEYIAATGAPGGFFYGNNVAPVYSYNSRLQANAFYATNGNSPDYYLLYSGYDWGMGNNNGTLHGSSEYYGNSVVFGALSQISQSYTYDGVNRLKTVTDSGYTQGFAYDQYGNMTTGGVAWDAASSTAGTLYTNNQAGPGCGTAGSVYDCAGNQVVVNGNTLAYDAENRQVSATSPAALGGGTESYLYDGNGQRVAKSGPGGVTTYVYDAFGQLAAEYGALNGTSPCLTCYLTWDALGSVRLVTGESGQVVARHDYLAFGGEIPASTAGRTTEWGGLKDSIAQKFTGQERDTETGLDYFGARYYGSGLGRFMSVDPMSAGADPTNPQSWNAYAYVWNNPLANVDPTGMDCQGNDDGVPCIVDNPPPPPPDPCDFDVFCGLPIPYPYPISPPPPPQPTPSQTGGYAPAKTGNDQVKRNVACTADALVSFGLSTFVPGYAAAKTVLGAFDVSVNPVQAALGYKPLISAGPTIPSAAAGASSGYWLYQQSVFAAAGGQARLDRLTDLTSRTSSGAANAAKYGSELNSLQGLAKAANFAGRVTGVLSAVSAGYDIYACWAGN